MPTILVIISVVLSLLLSLHAILLVPLKVNGNLISSTWKGSAIILCRDDGLYVEQEDQPGGEKENLAFTTKLGQLLDLDWSSRLKTKDFLLGLIKTQIGS